MAATIAELKLDTERLRVAWWKSEDWVATHRQQLVEYMKNDWRQQKIVLRLEEECEDRKRNEEELQLRIHLLETLMGWRTEPLSLTTASDPLHDPSAEHSSTGNRSPISSDIIELKLDESPCDSTGNVVLLPHKCPDHPF